MDLLFTLLLCAPYPAIGIHTARTVLHHARTHDDRPQRLGRRRLSARTWLFAAAMIVAWPAVEVLPPATRRTRALLAGVRRRASSTGRSA
jgi:hypothetical protein